MCTAAIEIEARPSQSAVLVHACIATESCKGRDGIATAYVFVLQGT